MKKNGAEILIECLLQENVEVLFGYPGGANMPIYDKLTLYPKLKHVLVRHEQEAAHAADAYGRATGRPGICLATSGPGATNLITGIATAYMDSSPMIAITGQVALPLIGTDAFQEIDIVGISLPITKHSYLVESVDDIPRIVKEAFHLAATGRPGPILIDIPKDIQIAQTDFIAEDYKKISIALRGYKPKLEGSILQIKKSLKLLEKAEKPLIITGHGVLISDATKELLAFAEKMEIPVVTTLLGISSFPEHHPLFYGYIGMHGFLYANKAIQESDVLVGIGIRFDDRITGSVSTFAPNAQIIHIDIDPAEIGKLVRTDIPIVGDAKKVLQKILREAPAKKHTKWIQKLDQGKKDHPVPDTFTVEHHPLGNTGRLNPMFVLQKLRELSPKCTNFVTDVGQHQQWAAQHLHFTAKNSHFSSGGLGTMGFAIPAGTGVYYARPKETVWVICGDGGFQMTNNHLATVEEEGIPLKIALFNNGYLGMVRQWQDLFYEKNYSSTPLKNPDFGKMAEAYGIGYLKVDKPELVEPSIKKALSEKTPFLLDFIIEEEMNVFPIVPSGLSLDDARHA